ncbi:MAG: tetratricopeptide repeat-containing protein [Methylocella sp.]
MHSGVIDVPMYDMLFAADLVVADLSTSNLNAIFELGVRHALKPRSTIIIAEEQFKDPFDVNHIVIRPYIHLGTDIGFDETMRMRQELQTLAEALKTRQAVDSPVYTVLSDLQQPARKSVAAAEAIAAAQSRAADKDTYAAKFGIAIEAKNTEDFDLAKKILQQIYVEQTRPGPDGKPKTPRPRVIQELALATYKAGDKAAETAGPDVALAAYTEAEELLQQLDPETTTSPETLGLWSAIHKRRAEMPVRSDAERRADLDIAVNAAERGFFICRDYYNGTNLAYLLNLRASLSSGDDRIADNVLAERARRQVVEISAKWLETLGAEKSAPATEPGAPGSFEEEKYWTAASHAESLIVLGDKSGPDFLQQAISRAPAQWMADATLKQLDKVKALLAGMQQGK